jgi:hypothetical protein
MFHLKHGVTLLGVVLLYCASLNAQINFEAPIIIDAPFGAVDIVVGHINTDGITDMITVGNTSDNISVHYGLGNVTFSAPSAFGAADSPQRIVSGDFNGDGFLDVAITSSIDDIITVRLNDGAGSFNTSATYFAGNTPIGIATNDFNGDGQLDLAVAIDLGDQIAIFLGNGDGTFQTAQLSFGGDRPQDIVSEDLNNDSFIDLIVSNRNDDQIGVFLGNGDGTFGTISSYAVGGDVPEYMELADLNGDSFWDVVTSNSFSDNISIILGNGDGSFGTPAVYTVSDTPKGLTLTDFNGDGFLDVAVACEVADNVNVLMGNGDGTFNTPINFLVGNGAVNTAHADIDGDGAEDLLVINRLSGGDVYILLNKYCPDVLIEGTNTTTLSGTDGAATVFISGGTPPYEILWDDLEAQTTATAVGLMAGNYTVLISDAGGCVVTESIEITDPICDFSLDILIDNLPSLDANDGGLSAVISGGTAPFSILWNIPENNDQLSVNELEAGSYTVFVIDSVGCPLQKSIYLMEASSFCESTFLNIRVEEIYFEDLDNDAVDDLIGLNPWSDNALIFEGDMTGSYTPLATYHTGEYTQHATFADFNGDGLKDMIATAPDGVNNGLAILFGNGDGTFQEAIDYFVGSRPWYIEHDDLDGDGDQDLLVSRDQGDNVRVFLNTGSGIFTPGVAITTGIAPGHMAKGDFNEDGQNDFVVSNSGQWHLSIILGNGTSTPTSGNDVVTLYQPYDVIAVDVNQDDHLDLITVHDGNDRFSVHLGNGDGTFQSEMIFDTPDQPLALSSGDYNNDGFVDIATANRNGNSVSLFLGSGNGEYKIHQTWEFDRPVEITTKDIDSDGDDDLVFALDNAVAPWKVMFFKNCFFQTSSLLGDFNQDGFVNSADLLLILSEFGCSVTCQTDLNGDGAVNTADFLLFTSVFGQ